MLQTRFMLRIQQYHWSSACCAGESVIRRLLWAVLLHALAQDSAVPAWDTEEVTPEDTQMTRHTEGCSEMLQFDFEQPFPDTSGKVSLYMYCECGSGGVEGAKAE